MTDTTGPIAAVVAERQSRVATIVRFRARMHGLTHAEAADQIVVRHHGGSWERWAQAHGLSEADIRRAVASIADTPIRPEVAPS